MKANNVRVPLSTLRACAPAAHRAPHAQREIRLWIAAAALLLAGGIACSNNDGPVFLDARDASDADSTADDGRRPPPDSEDDQTDPEDTEADTQADVEDDLPPPPTPCEEDADCDDYRFCNGTESCSEAGPGSIGGGFGGLRRRGGLHPRPLRRGLRAVPQHRRRDPVRDQRNIATPPPTARHGAASTAPTAMMAWRARWSFVSTASVSIRRMMRRVGRGIFVRGPSGARRLWGLVHIQGVERTCDDYR